MAVAVPPVAALAVEVAEAGKSLQDLKGCGSMQAYLISQIEE